MLRLAVARSARGAGQGFTGAARGQWTSQWLQQPIRRTLADARAPDKTILPGSQSATTAGVPQPPVMATATTNPTAAEIPPTQVPQTPPTPEEVGAVAKAATNTAANVAANAIASNIPPTGADKAGSEQSAPPPPPPKPRRRIRKFLTTLIVLSALGYGGGVYYSLISDNFHDFFTEYVPYGEDAVAYFEDREFRKRFPSKEYSAKTWPQTRGENKVTIPRSSGLTPRVAEEGDSKSKAPVATPKKAADVKLSAPATQEPKDVAKAAAPVKPIDHINVEQATEPAVQNLVKMVNNVITAINASPESARFQPVVENLKGDLSNAISAIGSLKEQHIHDAETQIQNAHSEFDEAAKELVRRLESQMREQEAHWREEYEKERQTLSEGYRQRLSAELEAAEKVFESKRKNALLQQEISLQKQYMDTVKAKVEEERSGRLSKLDELSSSVSELERLTSEWNSVVDATLQTQHLQIAVEAVKAKVLQSEYPTPFLNELVALKEVSGDDEVVNAAIASINPLAYQRGISSAAHLIDRFRRVASEVRKASLLPEDAGVASHAASAVLSRFMFQKRSDRGFPEGDDVEATLARTEVLLEEGDLDAAAREMNGLKGWANVLSRDWVSECRRVLEVKQAVDVIATEARLKSLLVD
ncbi:MICOS complex subunit MIC60-like protein [Acrodontium crateriforme]|uniref:MICOS complex subunit MIC60 n=1 Tax=Acrodontium crateriforme TaxID=150365 RepID=A0AAQ3LY09_9PEZI|nr:MICOS complex subunit MIC60-like protein [Acrodontium crateriforme]